MNYKIHNLDYSISAQEYFKLIKDNDWAVFLNSNIDK